MTDTLSIRINTKHYFTYFCLSLFSSVFFGYIILKMWVFVDMPGYPKFSNFYSNWIPILYILFTSIYFILYALGLRFKFDEYLIKDTSSYLLNLLFLFLIYYWQRIGDWHVWFSAFFLFLIIFKGFLLIKFLYINIVSADEIVKVPNCLKFFSKTPEFFSVKISLFIVALLIYFLLGAYYVTFYSTEGDEHGYLLVTHSLLKDHDTDINNNVKNGEHLSFFWSNRHFVSVPYPFYWLGQYVSAWHFGIGFPSLLIPGYALGGRLGATVIINIIGSLLMLNLYLLIYEIGISIRIAILVWILLSFSPPILIYSSLLYPEIPAAFLTVFIFRKIRQLSINMNNINKDLILILLFFVFLILMKNKYIINVFALTCLILIQLFKSKRRLIHGVLFILMCSLLFVAMDKFFFDGIFIIQRVKSFIPLIKLQLDSKIFTQMLALFWDQEVGILLNYPIYLLSFLGVIIGIKNIDKDIFFVFVYFFIVFYFYYVISFIPPHFEGWYWWLLRYFVCIFPIMGIPLAYALEKIQGKFFSIIVSLSILWSFLMSFALFLSPSWRHPKGNGNGHFLTWIGDKLSINLNIIFPSFNIRLRESVFIAILFTIIFAMLALYYTLQVYSEGKANNKYFINFVDYKFGAVFIILLVLMLSVLGYSLIWTGKNLSKNKKIVTISRSQIQNPVFEIHSDLL